MTPAAKPMIVAGVMSGTSADGVDVAFVQISLSRKPGEPLIEFIGRRSFPYKKPLRQAVLSAMDARVIDVADLARLHWRLGAVYADAIEQTATELVLQPALIGVHGQTVYHQTRATPLLGSPVRATWQLGEPSVIAERLRVPVISDFRPADLAAGGQGAPLVPMFDYCFFRAADCHRVLLNLGGIANVSVLPAGTALRGVIAFDSGPANLIMDALMAKLFNKTCDRNGQVAAGGKAIQAIVGRNLQAPYFSAPPPKSCGREQFGVAFVERFHAECLAAGGSDADVMATATELTVASIVQAYGQFCAPLFASALPIELIAAGGGVRNLYLLKQLRERFAADGVSLWTTDDFALPSEAKEAAAFALLAWLTWHGLPGNVPSATGAARSAILGKVTFA